MLGTAEQRIMASFVTMDQNRDHKIQREEFASYIRACHESCSQRMDEAEFDFVVKKLKKEIDKDGVCFIQFMISIPFVSIQLCLFVLHRAEHMNFMKLSMLAAETANLLEFSVFKF